MNEFVFTSFVYKCMKMEPAYIEKHTEKWVNKSHKKTRFETQCGLDVLEIDIPPHQKDRKQTKTLVISLLRHSSVHVFPPLWSKVPTMSMNYFYNYQNTSLQINTKVIGPFKIPRLRFGLNPGEKHEWDCVCGLTHNMHPPSPLHVGISWL